MGANVFVGNLHENVDEKLLRDVFSAFGIVLSTKIMRDPETGGSKRYGFVSYDNFESSDQAITAMNGQYLAGKPVELSYAYKKDSTKQEKHGSQAERLLSMNKPQMQALGRRQADNAFSGNDYAKAAVAQPPSMPPPPTIFN